MARTKPLEARRRRRLQAKRLEGRQRLRDLGVKLQSAPATTPGPAAPPSHQP